MHANETYHLKQELQGIVLASSPMKTVTIPKGASVTTVSGPIDGQRMIDVEWNGQIIMVFTHDLRERAELR